MLRIKEISFSAIQRHAEEVYPLECCGVLLGTFEQNARAVEKVIRCGNACTEWPQSRYSIDPRELIRIQRENREAGFEIVGFYHSHPDHSAHWSPTDLKEAHWHHCSYLIVSVQKGSAAGMRSFELAGSDESDKHFLDEELALI